MVRHNQSSLIRYGLHNDNSKHITFYVSYDVVTSIMSYDEVNLTSKSQLSVLYMQCCTTAINDEHKMLKCSTCSSTNICHHLSQVVAL